MKKRKINTRGMGNVYQPQYKTSTGEIKTSAAWWLSYYIDKRRIRENSHCENREDAIRLLQLRMGAAAKGEQVNPELTKITLDDLIEMVESDYIANGQRSINRVRKAAKHLRRILGGSTKARAITVNRVTSYKSQRSEEGAAPASINYELAILRRAFSLAAEAEKIAAVPKIKALKVDNARAGFFEPAQYRAVLDHLPDHLKPVLATAYITGWRMHSELLTRQWRHVDLAKGLIRLEPGEAKNRDGREFPFTPELREVLEAQREYLREIERTTHRIVPHVFCRPDGRPIKDIRGAWASACRKAGVPGRLVHDLRRTAVRNLERAGVPRSAAMKLTGHRTEAVYRRYAITDSAMLQEAVSKLAALHDREAV